MTLRQVFNLPSKPSFLFNMTAMGIGCMEWTYTVHFRMHIHISKPSNKYRKYITELDIVLLVGWSGVWWNSRKALDCSVLNGKTQSELRVGKAS